MKLDNRGKGEGENERGKEEGEEMGEGEWERVGGALVVPCPCRWQSRRPLETSRVSLAQPSGFRK